VQPRHQPSAASEGYLDEEELSALIMAMHQISQRQLPVVLVGAGLPQLVALAGRSKSYAQRLFQFPEAGALQPSDDTRIDTTLSDHGRLQGALRLTFTTPEFLDFGLIAAG
jgi:hypothetical protein